jgi:hypothetical protein
LAQIETANSISKVEREHALITALGACESLQSAEWRGDCALAAVQGLAENTKHATSALLQRCSELPSDVARWECAFQVGEQRNDGEACAQAGLFADDCRMHIFSAALARLKDVPDQGAETAITALAEEFGFAATDPRPWVAASRWLLGSTHPLERSRCDIFITEKGVDRANICRDAGQQLYNDRLNHARDTKRYPCDGSALPEDLETVDDDALDQLRLEREGRDLCP